MKSTYKANDGTTWDNPKDALVRDEYTKAVYEISKPFDDKIPSGKFIQRTASDVRLFIDRTYDLLVKYHSKESEIPALWKQDPRGFVGRYLDDGDDPAYHLYGIILSIDNNYRQWQQPYYAIQANKEISGTIK